MPTGAFIPPTVVPEAGEVCRLLAGGLTGLLICLDILAVGCGEGRRLRSWVASKRRLGLVVTGPENATCQAPPGIMMAITADGTGPGPWVPPRCPLGLRAGDPLRIYSVTVGLRGALPPVVHGINGARRAPDPLPTMLRGGLIGTRGFRGGHSPPLLALLRALFLLASRERRAHAFVFFIFAAETSVDRFELSPPAAMAGRSSSKKSSAQQASSHGAWLGSDVDEGLIDALRHHRLLPPASQVSVRLPSSETSPAPVAGEVVVFVEHFYRGFGLPASSFFAEWLQFFGLQPHHLAPNAILQLAAFVVLCEGCVGIEPRVDLWCSLFFFKQQSIAMEKSEVEKLKGPRPMTPCGAALVHHRPKSGFPQMPLQDSIKHWQKGFFYVRRADPAQDALNMPPFAIAPPTRRNWDAKTPRPHPEVALICAHLDILGKSGLLGRDLLATMVVRRILPLQRRPHLVCQMSGRLDPCRLSTKRFTPGTVARRVNLISTARMDEGGERTWGMSPFNRAHPPPMMFKTLQGSLRQHAPDLEVSDASEMEDEDAMEPRSDSSVGSEDPLESEGTETSGDYPRHTIADWTDDDEEASFCSDAAFEEDSDDVEEVTSQLLTRGRRQGGGATAADEAAGKKGKGATASRPASKRTAPGPPAGQRADGAKRRRGGGRRQVSVVVGEAEDADEDTASTAERAGWAAADASERELEIESKRQWDTAPGKTAVGQPRPSRVERPAEKRVKARQDPSTLARVEEPTSEAASRPAPRTEGAQPSEPATPEQVDLETIPVSPRAEAAPDAPVLALTAPDTAHDAPGATMDAPDAAHPSPAEEVAPAGTAP
ncbi:hypothetical protein D1007_55706 [Hordeum vulgare]|nr:hypothetical protein D1007_55706 [Hordeum vulgare]